MRAILEVVEAVNAEQVEWATAIYSELLRVNDATAEQGAALSEAMKILGKIAADVQNDLAIIAKVKEIERQQPTAAQVAKRKAAGEKADAIAMRFLPEIAAGVAKCAPSAIMAGTWLFRSLQTATWLSGPDRALFASLIRQTSAGVSNPVAEAESRYFLVQQSVLRDTIIDAHPDLFPGGQFDPRWSLEQPPPDTQADPSPEVSADVAGVEPAPAQADDTLPFTEPATE